MKGRRRHPEHTEWLTKLRHREESAASSPTAEGYLDLAAEYDGLGLSRESDRLRQLAELAENGGVPPPPQQTNVHMAGKADHVMLVEVIQTLSRATLTGELVVSFREHTGTETFHVYFDQGNIVNTSCRSKADGLKSFRSLLRTSLGNQGGDYQFLKQAVTHIPHLMHTQTEILLLTVMHDVDEETQFFRKAHP